MLRISKLTDYALLIMSSLARTPDEVVSATQIAHNLRLNLPTVSKILKILAEGELVQSVRGSVGGYHLTSAPASITVAQVITVMEGQIAMTNCAKQQSDCELQSVCLLRDNWKKINTMVYALLTQFTLLDLLKPLAIPGYLDVK